MSSVLFVAVTPSGPTPISSPTSRPVLSGECTQHPTSSRSGCSSTPLIDAAWGQFPPPDPRASLHAYVSNLRKLLAGIGVDARTALASAPPGYRLTVRESD